MKPMMILSVLGMALAPAWAQATDTPAPDTAKDTTKALSKNDRKAIEELAKMNTAEIKLSELAEQKANHPEVKQFAKQLVEEHSKNNQEIKELASKKGVDLPEPMTPPPSERSAEQKLSKLSGEKFDQEYMKIMIDDHRKVVNKVENVSARAGDPELKQWAEKTLPTVQQHLDMAKSTEQSLKTAPKSK